MSKTSNRRSRQEWMSLVERFKKSGKTQKAFCGAHGIAKGTFVYWLDKVKRSQASDKSFVPIKVSSAKRAVSPYILELPKGYRLEIPSGLEIEKLSALLKSLV